MLEKKRGKKKRKITEGFHDEPRNSTFFPSNSSQRRRKKEKKKGGEGGTVDAKN